MLFLSVLKHASNASREFSSIKVNEHQVNKSTTLHTAHPRNEVQLQPINHPSVHTHFHRGTVKMKWKVRTVGSYRIFPWYQECFRFSLPYAQCISPLLPPLCFVYWCTIVLPWCQDYMFCVIYFRCRTADAQQSTWQTKACQFREGKI